MTAETAPQVWIDIQLENLGYEGIQVVDLIPLLHSVPNAVVEKATLKSLTFVHKHSETSDAADHACRLDASKRGALKLAIRERRICSIRVPVSPGDTI